MVNTKWYVAPFQYPVSGLIETLNRVKSFAFGKVTVATLPPSSSPISVKTVKKLSLAKVIKVVKQKKRGRNPILSVVWVGRSVQRQTKTIKDRKQVAVGDFQQYREL